MARAPCFSPAGQLKQEFPRSCTLYLLVIISFHKGWHNGTAAYSQCSRNEGDVFREQHALQLGSSAEAEWCSPASEQAGAHGYKALQASYQLLGMCSGDSNHHFSSPLTSQSLLTFPPTWFQPIATAHFSSHLAAFCWHITPTPFLHQDLLGLFSLPGMICFRSASRSSHGHFLWSISSYRGFLSTSKVVLCTP